MKYILPLFLLVTLTFNNGFSQLNTTSEPSNEFAYHDVIYLVDGSIFRGILDNWNYGDEIVITLTTGGKITIPFEVVFKMDHEIVGKKKDYKIKRIRDFSLDNKGIYNTIGTTILMGSDLGFSLSYSVGHRINQWIGVGGGLAIEDFEFNDAGQILPIFAEMRGFSSTKNISPYYNVRLGYGFALKNEKYNIIETNGGIMFSPEIGFRFGGRDVQFFMGAGLRFQNASYTREIPWLEEGTETEKVTYKRINLRFGIQF